MKSLRTVTILALFALVGCADFRAPQWQYDYGVSSPSVPAPSVSATSAKTPTRWCYEHESTQVCYSRIDREFREESRSGESRQVPGSSTANAVEDTPKGESQTTASTTTTTVVTTTVSASSSEPVPDPPSASILKRDPTKDGVRTIQP